MNKAIHFDSGTVFIPPQGTGISGEYLCSSLLDPGDFYFLSHDCGTCTWYCPCEVMGSAKPIFVSKKKMNELVLSIPLNLNDTSCFRKVDSGRSCIYMGDTSHCYLPSLACGSFAAIGRLINWTFPWVVMTAQKKYVLIRLAQVLGESVDEYGPPPWPVHYYTNSIILTWSLQTNGTTNFNGISSIADGRAFHSRETTVAMHLSSAQINLYDLLGRKISITDIQKAKVYGKRNIKLFVGENNNFTKLLVVRPK